MILSSMASYKDTAPGDTLEIIEPESFITDPTLKLIILEIFPLIVAVFIVFMFLVVTLGGLTPLFKSIYRYKILPALRKFHKMYKRYKGRWGENNVENSSSSSSTDSDVKAALGLFDAKLDPSKSSRSDSVTSEKPRQSYVHHGSVVLLNPKYRPRTEDNDLPTPAVDKQEDSPTEENDAVAESPLPSDQSRRRRTRHKVSGLVAPGREGPPQGNNEVEQEPFKRMVYPHVMPKMFAHLRRKGPGQAQRAFAASPDFRAYDPATDVWLNHDRTTTKDIILIKGRQKQKATKNKKPRKTKKTSR